MSKLINIIGIAMFFILSLFSLGFCEEMTITTYYPSPYGSYLVLGWGNYPNTRGTLSSDQGSSIELGGSGMPYIDFSNDMTTDFDMRIKLTGDDALNIEGGSVGIGTATPGSYKLRIAGASAAVDAGQSWAIVSDVRLKKDIINLGSTLHKIVALRAVRYHTLQENATDAMHIGFIAQEVEKEFPEAVITDKDGYKAIAYDKFTAVLLEAIKAQQQEIQVLKQEVDRLSKKEASLK